MMLADAAPSVPSAGVDAGTVAGHAAGQTASTVAGAASSAPLPGGAGETLGGTVSSLGQTDALFTWGSYFQALAILFI
ncbi:MAG: hypothetical protein LIP28_01020, partial [Deltaproteobacteria bacterium]|nr:hypothetical protein [Deltaproteobacteria bacterium]